jgi:hypothetical protein
MATLRAGCPGCGLDLPRSSYPYDGYYLASPECWSVYNDVLAREYQEPVLFGRVHQLTVDAYAAQHAGGPHPDKSVCVHLVGLHLVLDRGTAPPDVPRRLQRLASRVSRWPHLAPPRERGPLTVLDVAQARSSLEHGEQARAWAESVWRAWSAHHAAIAELVRSAYSP